MKKPIQFAAIVFASTVLMLQGCNDNDSTTAKTYSVSVTNLTNNQALSPIGAILHNSGYHAYSLGDAADNALEILAESGDNSALLGSAAADTMVIDTTSGSGMIAPGNSETINVLGYSNNSRLTLATMLVNTNDAFSAIDAVDISELVSGESLVLYANVYDAGTETNSEAAADVPGQGGEGFNASRDDRNFVAVHAGVVSMDDGLTGSALDQSYRFDNPVAKIVVTRTQ